MTFHFTPENRCLPRKWLLRLDLTNEAVDPSMILAQFNAKQRNECLLSSPLRQCQDTETRLMPSCCQPTEEAHAFGFKSRLRDTASELSDGAKGFTAWRSRRGTSHILAPLNTLTTGPSIRKCFPTLTEGFAEP